MRSRAGGTKEGAAPERGQGGGSAGVCKGIWGYMRGKRGDRGVRAGKRWGEGGGEWGREGAQGCMRGVWETVVGGSGQDVLGNEGNKGGGGEEDLGCSAGP